VAYDLTIVVLTKNESKNLSRCLDAIPAKYRVVVVDSGSQDDTVAIAKSRGCEIYLQSWLGFAGQRNFALQCCGINKGWILFVDADEFYPPDFYAWFESNPIELDAVDVLMIPSFLFFCGRKLRFAPGYPIFHPRLVRAGMAPFVVGHAGHSETVAAGVRLSYGHIPYDHYFFNGDLCGWMVKHIDLARQEAVLRKPQDGNLTSRARLSLLFGSSFLRVPLRFMYHYILRRGFKDGYPGFVYSLMNAWYELTKYVIIQFGKVERDK
jgi:glycosyltransferase involved in cell wall biosynthesis